MNGWLLVLLAVMLAATGVFLAYCRRKRLHIWVPRYAADAVARTIRPRRPGPGLQHVLFLFVDHFELAGKADRLDAWMSRYPEIARVHRDADGHMPRHSWFYALDLMHEHEVAAIGQLVDAGMGELELHWHHDHDDEQSFRRKLRGGMEVFHRHGHMLPHREDRPATFGFIHGNWSLDNSRGARFCGVDGEIGVLLEEGCYADFTFPALFNEAQPSLVNRLYYAKETGGPKSYRDGIPARRGRKPADDELMLFQGPLSINWRDWRFRWHPTFEDGDINAGATHGEAVRIDAWVRHALRVEGRPEWLFVKVFCHGAQDHASVCGPASDRMFAHLEETYNDGRRFKLHYVTAREAYNVLRAAEDGKAGDPGQYRDYIIPAPAERRSAYLHRQRRSGSA